LSPARAKKSRASRFETASFLQFCASALGLMLFWTAAFGSLLAALGGFVGATAGSADLLLVAVSAFWAGLLLLPSAAYSLARLTRLTVPTLQIEEKRRNLLFSFGFSLLPVILLIGALTLDSSLAVLLSPLHVIAASLSVGLMLWLALRELPLGSAQLRWGGLASGLTAAPLFAITLEIFAGAVLGALGLFYLSLQPGHLQALTNTLQTATAQGDLSQLEPILRSLLSDPVIISLITVNFALFVPLIEELIKPIAVWLLVWGRELTPAQGFGLGALSGAGFALFENLFSGASAAAWPTAAFIRIGATAFHIATSALMGWAIVRAKAESRYFGVFAVYAFNILLHSLWNGAIVLTTLSAPEIGLGDSLPFRATAAMPLILALVTLISIAILYVMNGRLGGRAQPAVRGKPPTRS
jgi:hypothetical protein